ncbi:MAG: SRPBCC domain-containing protein, partial [Myxococcota bacterium]
MASEELRVSALIAASPNRIYSAWMDERQHSAFTGGRATIDPWVGGRHTAWDNYIEGTLVELDTGRRIVMTWRTSEFPPTVGDSKVEVQLEPVAGGTRVSVHHTQIPQGQSDRYKKVWRTHYLGPMKKYFGKPGAMRAALQAASKAGMLPIPGVTSARPGASRAAQPPRPEAEAGPETVAGASEGEGRRTAARPAPKKAPAKKKAAGKRKAPAKKKASTKKKAAAKKKKAAGKRKAPAKKKAST